MATVAERRLAIADRVPEPGSLCYAALQFGPHKVYKCGWDSDCKYAYYRGTQSDFPNGNPSGTSQNSPAKR